MAFVPRSRIRVHPRLSAVAFPVHCRFQVDRSNPNSGEWNEKAVNLRRFWDFRLPRAHRKNWFGLASTQVNEPVAPLVGPAHSAFSGTTEPF